jgi:hypothetical protein
MLAPPRTATRGRVPSGRALIRSALVGVGLLALTASGLPAAFAGTEESLMPVTFGGDLGKAHAIDLTIAPSGEVPPTLSLEGATLALTDGSVSAMCTTDAAGVCEVQATNGKAVSQGTKLQLPAGVYTVRQTGGIAGLQVDGMRYWQIELCMPGSKSTCASTGIATITNTSLYRRHLSTTVLSAGAADGSGVGAPLAGAAFELTGPDYPRRPAVPNDDGIYDGGTATSGPDGVLTFDGWFRPGTWTLTPVGAPDGHVNDAPVLVVVSESVPTESSTAWGAPVTLARTASLPEGPDDETPGDEDPGDDTLGDEDPGDDTPGDEDPGDDTPGDETPGDDTPGDETPVDETPGDGNPAAPTTTPAPVVTPPPPTQGAAPSAAGRGNVPSAGSSSSVAVPRVAGTADEESAPVAVPSASPTRSRTTTTNQPPAPTSADTLAGSGIEPVELTPASNTLMTYGTIGFGILFLAVVVIGIGVVRRRARRD